MAKYLRDLSIHIDPSQKLPGKWTGRDFNETTHTVQNIFRYQIPPKYEMLGMAKLNIVVQEKGTDKKFINLADGIGIYKYTGFDFSQYFELSVQERNERILEVLKGTLHDILETDENSLAIALEIADSIESMNFCLETESSTLSKYNSSRKVRASVIYRVDEHGENAFIRIKTRNGEYLVNEHLLRNHVYEYWNNLYKSKWVDDRFRIIDRNNNVFKEFKVDLPTKH